MDPIIVGLSVDRKAQEVLDALGTQVITKRTRFRGLPSEWRKYYKDEIIEIETGGWVEYPPPIFREEIAIRYQGKLVFGCDCYRPGRWEDHLNELYEKLPDRRYGHID